MKSRTFTVALFVLFFCVNGAYAQNTYYLSHFANGNYGDGSFRMTVILFNNGNTDTTATLKLSDDNGLPLTVTINGWGTASQFDIPLPAGGSQMLQTDGLGSLVRGAAVVTSAAKIEVSAIFTIYDANGNYVTETGVGSSEPSASFVLPVDTTGSFNTGLALFNFNGTPVSMTLTLRGTDGQQVGTVPLTLNSLGHTAVFIAGAEQLFPSFTNFQGTLLIQSAAPIAAMVLRQNLTPLSYTSLPVVSTSSTKLTLNLAHEANGTHSDGSFKTSYLIFNISASPANVTLALTQDNGNPLNVAILGRGTASSFVYNNLPPGGSLFLQTDGAGPLSVGAATITSNVPVGASAIFTVFDSQGAFQTETGVGDSPVLTSLTLPVDITGDFDTGVAFFAPGSSGAILTFQLLSSSGTLFGSSATRTLEPRGHLALFLSQVFPGTSNFRGSVAINATSGVAALTLRQNSSPLSYTTLPVASGTSSGKAPTPATALLSKAETGIAATNALTLNEVLPSGFKLTGTVTGPGRGRIVTASAGPDSGFSGTVDQQTGKYSILLPGGTYSLTVSFTPNGAPSGQNVAVHSAVSGAVQVSGDTTRDITLPAVPLFNVSGILTGLSNLPPLTSLPISFNSTGDPAVSVEFNVNTTDGSYQGMMPAGSYTAGITAPITFSVLQTQSLGLLNLGSAIISGNTTIPPFAVPAMARLSGTLRSPGYTLFGGTIVAIDSAASVFGTSTADFLSAQYQMILPKNLAYAVSAATALVQGASTVLGVINFPLPASSVSLAQDTANFDFTAPPLPARVTISGKVTDSGGNPVGSVAISASSSSITGGQISQFNAFAQTDASGNYSIVVLSGTNYLISFIPPPPTQ